MNYPFKPTFLIKTLGCKVNQYESQAMREQLVQNNFLEKTDDTRADFYIINSCTVTRKADRDTRNLIHRFHRQNPQGKIIIAGCYAELDDDRKSLLDIPGVTHLVKNNEKHKIAEILITNSRLPAYRPGRQTDHEFSISDFSDRDRAFVKIQDGCDHKCAYCKVNIVRGPSRSRPLEEILNESRRLIVKGFKEIVLTGICLGSWGKDISGGGDLPFLLQEISDIEGTFRIRLSSIEPCYVTGSLINVIKDQERICKHLHIPLQSGDDGILKLMRRPYTVRWFGRLARSLRKSIPDIAITTDMLLGFPGENEKRFMNTVRFLKSIAPSRIHVFSYSERTATPAAEYNGKVTEETKKQRVKFLTDLGSKLSINFARGFVGKKERMLVESSRDKKTNLLTGYTDRYIRVLTNGPDRVKNSFATVRIKRVDETEHACFAHLDNDHII